MRSIPRCRSLLLALGACILAQPARALINPNFTPIHLVSQSDQILEVTFAGATEGATTVTATVKTSIKGKDAPRNITLNLSTSAFPEHTAAVAKAIHERGSLTALFFSGKMTAGDTDNASGEGGEKGLLHMGTTWISFGKGKTGSWDLDRVDEKMLATWNGDTAMLRAAVMYILSDPSPDLPCAERVNWGTSARIAQIPGRVCACLPVVLTDAGAPALLVASDAGDHLLQWNATAGKVQDITAAHRLATKSLAVAWGDWNGDGRFDLVSWNGENLTLHAQEADGSFPTGPSLPKSAIAGDVVSLAMLDVAAAGHPAVLVGTTTTPLLWSPYATNVSAAVLPIVASSAPAKKLGAGGRCLVADFDGCGLPDVLQLFVHGSLLYKGVAPGRFALPIVSDVALGSGPATAFLGDFDQDGLLDVFTTGDAICLWNNRGGGLFVDTMAASGEPSYKGSVNACGGAMGDFNCDGLQDMVFFYPADIPNLNFNRGFRSFGHANKLDFQSNPETLPGAEGGQQAGCWADLDGDGVPELVVVLKDGAVWRLPFDTGGEKGRCVQVMLTGKGAHPGSVSVTAWHGKRGLGAWNVTAGAPAMISQPEAGPVTLKWRLPGGQLQSRDLVIENAPVKFTLP